MTAATQESTAADILLADNLDLEALDLEALFYLDIIAGRQEDGKTDIENLLPSLASKPDAEVRTAAAYLAIGDLANALVHAEKISNHPFGAMVIGLAKERENKNEEALKSFQKAAQGAPTVAHFAL
ncbi:MAG: hypothetical protein LIQ30_02825, partial [Planctomycetes bacterium]|nr:hypothetical protein [Planctomycetota bacterium]